MSPTVILGQIESEKSITENGIWDLVVHADPIVQFTLLVLVVFSIVSWAIIFYKYKQVKQAQSDSQSFWANLLQSSSMEKFLETRESRSGPLYEIFSSVSDLIPKLKNAGNLIQHKRNQLYQKLTQAREEEIYKLEQYTPFLATTASTTPFIGLFGTVWGILTAFWTIGKAGSSSLATVGPYISEALIATALGLAAAIPAVIAYNYFVHRIKIITKMMDLFVDDLVLKVEEETAS